MFCCLRLFVVYAELVFLVVCVFMCCALLLVAALRLRLALLDVFVRCCCCFVIWLLFVCYVCFLGASLFDVVFH